MVDDEPLQVVDQLPLQIYIVGKIAGVAQH
jgi:hypothetical protein